MKGNVGVFGVGQTVEVGPEHDDGLGGHDLNGRVDLVVVIASERLAEPGKGLALTQSCEGGAGRLTNFRMGIAPAELHGPEHILTLKRLPPSQTAESSGANAGVTI